MVGMRVGVRKQLGMMVHCLFLRIKEVHWDSAYGGRVKRSGGRSAHLTQWQIKYTQQRL